MTTVSINQPCYLPWLPYFDRIRLSDIHVVLDHVQYEKGSFTNRTRIRQKDGRVCWLTVPVEKGKRICDTPIANDRWQPKHRKTIRQAYGEEADGRLARLFSERLPFLDLACLMSECVLALDPDPPWPRWTRSSQMGGDKLGHKSDLVLNICKELGADKYLSGPMGRNYLDIPAFDKAGIEVVFYVYHPPALPLSAVHDLFSGKEFQWPQAELISAHS